MEYLVVLFPTRRVVLIDQDLEGWTNEILELEGGRHDLTLRGRKNFRPEVRSVVLGNTAPLRPIVEEFEKIA